MSQPFTKFASGARRSADIAEMRFDLVPEDALAVILPHCAFSEYRLIREISEIARAGGIESARKLYAAFASERIGFALNAARYPDAFGPSATDRVFDYLGEAFLAAFRMADPATYARRDFSDEAIALGTSLTNYSARTQLGYEGMKRLAATFHEGAVKYGEFNWRKGFPFDNLLSHARGHADAVAAGEQSDPQDIGHAIWNILIAAWSWAHCPHLNAHIRSEDIPLLPALSPEAEKIVAGQELGKPAPSNRSLINHTIARDLARREGVERFDESESAPGVVPADSFRDPTGLLAGEEAAPPAP